MADPAALRELMVAKVFGRIGSRDERLAAALRAVPRHVFLPEVTPEAAYADDAVVTKRAADGEAISSSSQPTIMAVMLDQLDVRPGHRVLEIGAGTGYNAALLALLVAPGGAVVTVDIDQDLVDGARAALAAVGATGVRVACGDGAEGFPDTAPYDRVIATVGVWDLAPAWSAQLAPGGRIVVPLDLRGWQVSVAFERAGGHWVSRSVVPCGFMRMRGPAAGPGSGATIDAGAALSVRVPDGTAVAGAELASALAGQATELNTGIMARAAEVFDGLSLWLAAREPRWCTLSEQDSPAAPVLDRATLRVAGLRLTRGIVAGGSIAALVRGSESEHSYPLAAAGYGPRGHELAAELVGHVQAWQAADRPSSAGLRIEAHPASTSDELLRDRLVIDKRHTRLALGWP